jgi:hypothetical protein
MSYLPVETTDYVLVLGLGTSLQSSSYITHYVQYAIFAAFTAVARYYDVHTAQQHAQDNKIITVKNNIRS